MLQDQQSTAISVLEEALDAYPTCLEALVMMIHTHHASGQLESMEKRLDRLGNAPSISSYCKGIYHGLKGRTLEAIECFHEAKADEHLHDASIFEMVDLILNLDDLTYFWDARVSDQEKERRQQIAHALLNEVQSIEHP